MSTAILVKCVGIATRIDRSDQIDGLKYLMGSIESISRLAIAGYRISLRPIDKGWSFIGHKAQGLPLTYNI